MRRVEKRWRDGLRAAALLACLAIPVLSGCEATGPDEPEPASARLSPGFLDFDAVGDTATLSAVVIDQDGNVLADASVDWRSSDDGIATVSPAGLVTSAGNGTATITVTAGNATATLSVTVAQAGAALELLSGGAQTGAAGERLPQLLVVRVNDRLGHPSAGVPVTFLVEEGGGAVGAAEVTTDASGRASTTWTLGQKAGQPQRLEIFLSRRVGVTLDARATAVAGVPTVLRRISGDAQASPRLQPLPQPIVVRAEDRFGNPVARVSVAFAVVSGGGSVEPAVAATDTAGQASARWTLGEPLGEQSLSATLLALPAAGFRAIASHQPVRAQVVAGGGQSATVGAPVPAPPSIRIFADGDVPVAGLDVRFSVVAGGGLLEPVEGGARAAAVTVRTDATGSARVGAWLLGTRPGTQEVRVEVPGLAPVTLTAMALTGPPTVLVRIAGDGQVGVAGRTLSAPLTVRVTDAFGNPVPETPVTFRQGAGHGSLFPGSLTTDSVGIAATRWTLGPATGFQQVTASIPTGATVPFQGRATNADGTGMRLELRFLDAVTPSQRQAFTVAAGRWEALITRGLTPARISLPARNCGSRSTAVDGTVEGLILFVSVDSLDGFSGTLASAGPCVYREGPGLPAVGRISVDAYDLVELDNSGRLGDVLTHEMAHALGFGTMWRALSLLQNPSLPSSRGVDTYFNGPRALAAFNAIGGLGYSGAQVPGENEQGGGGTRDSHWRESVMGMELMSGFLSRGVNPLSRVTLGSLRDLGYEVDELSADAYALPFGSGAPGLEPPGEAPLPLGDDIIRGPVYVLDREGRVHLLPDPGSERR